MPETTEIQRFCPGKIQNSYLKNILTILLHINSCYEWNAYFEIIKIWFMVFAKRLELKL